MSRTALVLLMATLACCLSLTLLPEAVAWRLPVKVGALVFGGSCLIALVIGRRIKFDPVLR